MLQRSTPSRDAHSAASDVRYHGIPRSSRSEHNAAALTGNYCLTADEFTVAGPGPESCFA
ncbi:hypothetical protein ACFLXE_01030 [Chloroflexota bacterium]